MHVKQQNVTPWPHFKLNISIASGYEQLTYLRSVEDNTQEGGTRREPFCLVIPEAIGAFKIWGRRRKNVAMMCALHCENDGRCFAGMKH